MNQIKIHNLTEKTSSTCNDEISIGFNDLKKHQLSNYSNLSHADQLEFERFTTESVINKPNSFLDYYCPTCKTPIRLLYESWAGGRHGEYGYDLKTILTKEKEKNTGHNIG